MRWADAYEKQGHMWMFSEDPRKAARPRFFRLMVCARQYRDEDCSDIGSLSFWIKRHRRSSLMEAVNSYSLAWVSYALYDVKSINADSGGVWEQSQLLRSYCDIKSYPREESIPSSP